MKRTALLALILVLSFGCAQKIAPLRYETANNGVQDLVLQQPLPAEQTVTRLHTPEGFDVRVFAAEPDIINPIALAWDERGRLWVLESTDYPHEHVGTETGTDRITICEDTNGDGRADRFIRFAENQPLSTALMVVKGGALVGQAPHIVYMEDTDGDNQYDRKTRVVEDAFGTFDTHAVMSNFKYGIDNHIWSAVGYSGMFKPGEAPNRESRILARGVFRFSRDGAVLEPVGQFNNNTWGVGIGEDNTIFGSTANNNHAVVVGIPMRYGTEANVANVQSHYIIEHRSEQALQQVDFRDGYTAAAGAFPYAGRRYPQKYWGALMVTEPTGHVVHPAYLEPNGSIFREKQGVVENLLASSDDWVAPVFADLGPDENIWVADWYNPVIQHNPDRRGMRNQIWNADAGPGNAHLNPLRDTQHGRVYVVHYTGNTGSDITSLSPDDADGLVQGLQSSNQFWRLTAQRLIIENNVTSLVPQLVALIEDESMDALGLNTAAVHALWTLHGLGRIAEARQAVVAALQHPSPAVRKAALHVLPETPETGSDLIAANLFRDTNLNTRLAAILKVLDVGDEASLELKQAAQAALQGGDEWITAAIDKLNDAPAAEPTPVATQPAPSEDDLRVLPPALLILDAAPDLMAFQQTSLHAFENQPITLVFNNIHPDLHNVVVLEQDVDVAQFGQALNAYITDPNAIENEYIPPSEQDKVLGSTGVLEQDQSTTITLEGLPAGTYTYLCTVPGHWAVMQGVLTVEPAPELPRNDAGWQWASTDADHAKTIVYLAGSVSRGQQSHYHARIFGFADGQVLTNNGTYAYTYTETADAAFVEALYSADLLAMANNKPVTSTAAREAIFAHVNAGKPLMLTHPAAWYNWQDWEPYNTELVGGGSRSHERLQAFTVEVIQPNHPLMQGVPASFDVVDELYRSELLPDANASVLAIGRSLETGAIYPVVWIRQHGDATILVNTLGHDDRTHNLAAYKQIVANARDWLLQ